MNARLTDNDREDLSTHLLSTFCFSILAIALAFNEAALCGIERSRDLTPRCKEDGDMRFIERKCSDLRGINSDYSRN
jgi:hypothetical protein